MSESKGDDEDMTAGALPADLVRLGDASKQTGVPVPTLRYWIKHRGLTAYREAGYWLMVSLADVERFRRIERIS